MTHFKENFNATGWPLSAEQAQRLTGAGDADLPYPYDFITCAPDRRRTRP